MVVPQDRLISLQAAIDAINARADEIYETKRKGATYPHDDLFQGMAYAVDVIKRVPSAQPEGYVKIPDTGIDDFSDGYHTFRQLYYQRMMLFATIVKQNKDKAWKSLRHEDGELCFGGGWFIVGIDTPEGSYTYHYESNFYSLFDCEELERSKHWDGHTEKDVTRLLSLPSAQSERKKGKWITTRTWAHDGEIYCDQCESDAPTEGDYRQVKTNFCPNCGADMRGEQE